MVYFSRSSNLYKLISKIASNHVSNTKKVRFHEPTKPANETTLVGHLWANDGKFGRQPMIWSSHCTVADKLKPTNYSSKNGQRMRYSTADKHKLTCLIFWSVPPTVQKDKSSSATIIGHHNHVFPSSVTVYWWTLATKLLSLFSFSSNIRHLVEPALNRPVKFSQLPNIVFVSDVSYLLVKLHLSFHCIVVGTY